MTEKEVLVDCQYKVYPEGAEDIFKQCGRVFEASRKESLLEIWRRVVEEVTNHEKDNDLGE